MGKNYQIIAFEGLDCSFKETNHRAFVERLQNWYNGFSNVSIHTESFPRYRNESSIFLKKWLGNRFDRSMMKDNPKIVDTFYSLDRFCYWYEKEYTAQVWNDDLHCSFTRINYLNSNDKFRFFVFDRYNFSNTIYNPIHPGEVHIEDFVFDRDNFNIPNPDVIVWMRMRDFDTFLNVLAKKEGKDANEMDIEFLRGVWERSEQLIHSDIYNKIGIKLVVIDVLNDDNTIKTKEEIEAKIWEDVFLNGNIGKINFT